MSYSIGSITFLTFPYPSEAFARNQTEIEMRAGVDYHSTWVTGERGRPMQILAMADVADWSAGQTLITNAFAQIGTAVQITHNGGQGANLYDVLDVQPGNQNGGISPLVLGVGGLSGTSGAIVELIYTIIETGEAVTP